MPIYDYLCEETGETAEITLPMADAPPVGHVRMHEGKRFVRQLADFLKPCIPSYEFTSVQVPDDHPDAPHHLPDGTAAFSGKEEVRQFCDRTQKDPTDPFAFHMHGRK